MNNDFDFDRFGHLVRADLRAMWESYRMTLLVIIVAPLMVMVLWYLMIREPIALSSCVETTLFCMFVAACMAPSRIYKNCNIPNNGVHFALLPATQKEKFWSMLLICEVVVPLIVLLSYVVLYVIVMFIPGGPFQSFDMDYKMYRMVSYSSDDNVVRLCLMVACALFDMAIFFFTNTVFKRHKVTMTLVTLMVLGWGFGVVMVLFSWLIPPSSHVTGNTDSIVFLDIVIILVVLATIGIYGWSYIRLKNMKY